jgi:hypothetical protein
MPYLAYEEAEKKVKKPETQTFGSAFAPLAKSECTSCPKCLCETSSIVLEPVIGFNKSQWIGLKERNQGSY